MNKIGEIIKYHRTKRNLSQEFLANNICVVSYLSKIEQGKTIPSKEVINLLLNKLGINTKVIDQNIIDELDRYFDLFVKNEKIDDKLIINIKNNKSDLLKSTYLIKYLLFDAINNISFSKKIDIETLSKLESCMDNKEQFFYLLIKMYDTSNENELLFDKAISLENKSIVYLIYTSQLIFKGEYLKAANISHIGYQKACDEGHVRTMYDFNILLGNIYANQLNYELMMKYYTRGMDLTKYIKADYNIIYYNIGSTLLNMNQYQDGLENLLKIKIAKEDSFNFWIYHKITWAYIFLADYNNASINYEKCLNEYSKYFDDKKNNTEKLIFDILKANVEKDNVNYVNKLNELMNNKDNTYDGYVRFHLPMILKYYTENRKYKEAYLLKIKFS